MSHHAYMIEKVTSRKPDALQNVRCELIGLKGHRIFFDLTFVPGRGDFHEERFHQLQPHLKPGQLFECTFVYELMVSRFFLKLTSMRAMEAYTTSDGATITAEEFLRKFELYEYATHKSHCYARKTGNRVDMDPTSLGGQTQLEIAARPPKFPNVLHTQEGKLLFVSKPTTFRERIQNALNAFNCFADSA